jgi:hypothetical protein
MFRHDEILGLFPRLNFGPDGSPGLWLFVLELIFWMLVAVMTVALMRFRPAWLDYAEHKLRQTAQYQAFWLVGFPFCVVVLRIALLPWIPVPTPVMLDEFSYLVGADTFAHGRLSNPTTPVWVHFETFHVNMQPTYHSMYPPAQAAALAIGQKLTGIPWTGVLLTAAFMCGAIYWMLAGWLPSTWAWLGGVFVVLRYSTFSYWMNSYFGGSVAALGGALVLGAFVRLRRGTRWGSGALLAVGLLLLAFSRPLEGLCFSIPIFIALAVQFVRKRAIFEKKIAMTLAPGAVLLLMGFGFLLYYNWRTTLHPLLMPYMLNLREYHISNPFLFQKPNPIPQYRHEAMRAFYVFHELPDVLRLRTESPAYLMATKANVYYTSFIWPFLLLVGSGLYAMWRSELRIVLFSMALLGGDLFLQIWPAHAHYAAPATGAFVLMALFGLRSFRNSQGWMGVCASRSVAFLTVLCLLSPVLECLRDPYSIHPIFVNSDWQQPHASFETAIDLSIPLQVERQRLQAELEKRPGKHLVIVHHPYHDMPSVDWIYNKADLSHAKVLWARDMGYLKNKELLNYYPDRQVWFVDRAQSELIPYEQAMLPWKLALDSPPFGPASDQGISAKTEKATPKPQIPANSTKEQAFRQFVYGLR